MNASRDLSSTYLLEENWDDFVSNGIPSIVILTLIALVGTVGNLITCFVSFFRKQSSTHQTLVMFLAAVDLCSCTISIPLAALWIRYPYTFTSAEVCKLSRFLSIFLSTCSYIVLDIIAIERYGKVAWTPEKQLTPTQAKIVCVSAYIFSGVIVSVPALFIYGISERTTPKRHLTGYECTVLSESRGTLFIKVYLYFGVLLLLVLFGCCLFIYGLIGRHFIRLSRSSQLKPSESTHKSIIKQSDQASAILSDFSVSFSESEKCNHRRSNDTAQKCTASTPKIVVTDTEDKPSVASSLGINNNDTSTHRSCHCVSKVRKNQPTSNSDQEATDVCNSLPLQCDQVSVMEPGIEVPNISLVNIENALSRQTSELALTSLDEVSSVNVICGFCRVDKRKRTVKFSTDIEVKTVDDQSRGLHEKRTLSEMPGKLNSKNVNNNGKLGKKILRGKKVTFMFFVLSLISILSYLPFFTILVLRNMDWTIYDDIRATLGPWEGVLWSLVYVNNAINPVFYGFMDSVFRKDCGIFIEQVKYYVF